MGYPNICDGDSYETKKDNERGKYPVVRRLHSQRNPKGEMKEGRGKYHTEKSIILLINMTREPYVIKETRQDGPSEESERYLHRFPRSPNE
jgi:hypothetical protein